MQGNDWHKSTRFIMSVSIIINLVKTSVHAIEICRKKPYCERNKFFLPQNGS